MNKKTFLAILLSLILFACTPASTPTSTQTPVPTATTTATATPIPLTGIEGILFFDQNGNGLKDETEPPVANISVCVKNIEQCITTDEKGLFLFDKVAPENTEVQLSFNTQDTDNPQSDFRYISLWKDKVEKPALDVGAIKVPMQKLDVTEVIPIANGIKISAGSKIELGLMQGFLTFPFSSTDYYVWTWFDIDARENHGLDWKGETSSSTYNNLYKIFDNHYGIDWLLPSDAMFVAPAPAIVREIHKLDDETLVTLEHSGTRLYTHYGHIEFSTLAVKVGDRVERGQYIASLTKSPPGPGDYPLPNMLHGQIQCCQQIKYPLVQSELFDFYSSDNFPSFWTVNNDPRFYQ